VFFFSLRKTILYFQRAFLWHETFQGRIAAALTYASIICCTVTDAQVQDDFFALLYTIIIFQKQYLTFLFIYYFFNLL
jgi:hypothetical protein